MYVLKKLYLFLKLGKYLLRLELKYSKKVLSFLSFAKYDRLLYSPDMFTSPLVTQVQVATNENSLCFSGFRSQNSTVHAQLHWLL